VIQRGEKNFTIEINNRNVTVSIDQLNAAFLLIENIEQQSVDNRDVIIIPLKNQIERSGRQTNRKNKYVTRTGRKVRFPDCFQAGYR
jgi:DNA helicase TIP49 (TBP-interacting protein)